MDLKKQGAKNRVIAIQEEKRQASLFSLITNVMRIYPIFTSLYKALQIGGNFFFLIMTGLEPSILRFEV